MKKFCLYLLFSCFFIISLEHQSYPTTLVKFNFEELIKDAELIFIGDVLGIIASWGEGGNTIYSYVTFGNLEIIDGQYLENSINLRFEGGRIGPIELVIPGIPRFIKGEKNLLFMRGNTISKCPLSGWVQGRFKIVKQKETNRCMVLDEFGNRIRGVKNAELIRKPYSSEQDYFLEDFISEIHKKIESIPPDQMRKRTLIRNIIIPAEISCVPQPPLPLMRRGEEPKKEDNSYRKRKDDGK